MTRTHGASTYRRDKGRNCRCDVCRQASTLRARTEKAQRFASRVLIAGRLIALNASVHNANTYSNWGCRCVVCSEGNRLAGVAYRVRVGAKANRRAAR